MGERDEAERREVEKFLHDLERTSPWNTGRSPGIGRTDATPLGCAAHILIAIAFVLMLFRSMVGLVLLPLSVPLLVWANLRARRQRDEYAAKVFADEPATGPEGGAGRSERRSRVPRGRGGQRTGPL